jgi:hypothetical protein
MSSFVGEPFDETTKSRREPHLQPNIMDDERAILHDAMPYVDRDYDVPEMKLRVQKMIAEELAKGGNREETTLPKDIELFSVGSCFWGVSCLLSCSLWGSFSRKTRRWRLNSNALRGSNSWTPWILPDMNFLPRR